MSYACLDLCIFWSEYKRVLYNVIFLIFLFSI